MANAGAEALTTRKDTSAMLTNVFTLISFHCIDDGAPKDCPVSNFIIPTQCGGNMEEMRKFRGGVKLPHILPHHAV